MARNFVAANPDRLDYSGAVVSVEPCTISCWAKSATGSGTSRAQVAISDAGSKRLLLWWDNSDKLEFQNGDGVNANSAVSVAAHGNNVWQHVAGVAYSNSSIACFLAGVKAAQSGSTVTLSGLNTTRVGGWNTGSNTFPFNGDLAHVAIWNVALLDSEITSLAAGADPRTIQPSNLIFYVPLNGTISPEPDVIGGKSLTVTGATKSTFGGSFNQSGHLPLVQAQAGGDGTTATTAAIDTTGATVIFATVSHANLGSVALSDSKGNTWTLDKTFNNGANFLIDIWRCNPTIVGSGHTFSAIGSSKFPALAVLGMSGGSATLDQTNSNGQSGGSYTTVQTGSVTPSTAGQTIIGAFLGNVSTTLFTAVDSGLMLGPNVVGDANSLEVLLGYQCQASATTRNPTATFSGTVSQTAAAIATYAANATIPAGSISLIGYAPKIILQLGMPAGSLAFTGYAPSPQYTVYPGGGSVAITGYAPVITNSRTIAPGAGAISITGYAPSLQLGIGMPSGALIFAGAAPALRTTVGVPKGSIAFTGYAPQAQIQINVQIPAGSLSFAGYAPTTSFDYLNPAHVWLLENGTVVDPLDGNVTEYNDVTPNRLTFVSRGTRPQEGDTILAYLGSPFNNADRKFGGTITSVQTVDGENTGDPAQSTTRFSSVAMDWAWGLQEGPKVNQTYVAQTGNYIAADLISKIAGYTGAHVQAGLVVVPVIVFKNASVMDCLKQLRDYLNTQYSDDVNLKVDYFKDVHLTVGADASIPTPTQIDTSHPTLNNFTWTRDINPVVTRAVTSGNGSQAAGPANPGDTLLALEDASWAQDGGGYVEIAGGTQRLSYTGRQVGVGGSLVGPGVGPTTPAVLSLAVGTGLGSGQYDYTVVWRTSDDTHLSLESAVATIITGLLAPPTTHIAVAGPSAGGSVTPGGHDWAITYGDGTHETTISASITGVAAWRINPPTVAPVISDIGGSWSPSSYTAGTLLYPSYTYVDALGQETSISPDGAPITVGGSPGAWHGIQIDVPGTSDPNVAFINIYQSWAGSGGFRYLAGQCPATGGSTQAPAAWFSGVTPRNQIASAQTFTLTWPGLTAFIAANPTITILNLYRTAAGGSQMKRVASFSSALTSYQDTIPDSSLGVNAPTVNGMTLNNVNLVSVTNGPAAVTQKWIFRSAVGGGQRKLVHKITDNTTTTWGPDNVADGSLGANAPTSDTSGLSGTTGQVLAGSSTLQCAGVGWAFSTGGWAACNGMIIRYTGLSGNTLTGIPTSGLGSITSTIAFNSTISAASTLLGIPASGTGSILYAVNKGDAVNLLSIRNDTAAQAALQTRLRSDGNTDASGIFEDYVVLGMGVPQAACDNAGDARLAQSGQPIVGASWVSNDPKTTAGATVPINRTDLVTSLVVQQVMFGQWNRVALRAEKITPDPHEYPIYQVSQAGNQRFALDRFMRRQQATA